ncbi:peptidase M23 [Pseudothermotoga hypogea DSM 11164 = NBRC 106472]|uniref:Peptidase M23 n=1 Tax=Pseudothermotoga hypogea DSM 11164 = NBRC 106472 TaxID=1123384 RepID=A0A0X1KT74_9THEM|nr:MULTISPECIES: M23 family metallopeptidase [Pseudothermotoga]AJC74520.1 peptidase M23 [Pseudothermotoga hypogea DSM 11164 = NBRC 106472]MDI6863547.1 M23 family metallopeptidase [Pseudothermotoga sp.]
MRKLISLVLIVVSIISMAMFMPPVGGQLLITSSFGEFRGTGNRGPHFHMGADFSTQMRSGVPILAAADGWLVRVEIDEDDIYGNVVVLQHENGFRTLYAHLSGFSEKIKSIIDSVVAEFGRRRIVVEFPERNIWFKAQEVIGYSGQTGEAAQPHCHFEIRNIDETVCYNPSDMLNIPKPADANFTVRGLMIDGERLNYTENEVYRFRGSWPKIAIDAVASVGRNVIGLRSLRLYFNNDLVYHIDFSEIRLEEFNNVWAVYTENSVADGYRYTAYYKLYPDKSSNVVKLNRFPELGQIPSRTNVTIVCEDVWKNEHEVKFVLERR